MCCSILSFITAEKIPAIDSPVEYGFITVVMGEVFENHRKHFRPYSKPQIFPMKPSFHLLLKMSKRFIHCKITWEKYYNTKMVSPAISQHSGLPLNQSIILIQNIPN